MSIPEKINASKVLHRFEGVMKGFLWKRRDQGYIVSGAHDEGHLRAVSVEAQMVSDIYQFGPRVKLLAGIAGLFHDIIREPTEAKNATSVGLDEELSAEFVGYVMEGDRRSARFSDLEINAVRFAITSQSTVPKVFKGDDKEVVPTTLSEKVHLALFVADKLQANGAEVIARRPHFVAGERLQSENGDLKDMGFDPNNIRDRLKVVAIESLLRLAYINPEHFYPKRLRDLVAEKYKDQREFVRGVIEAGRFRIVKLVEELLAPRSVYGGKSMLENKKAEVGEVSAQELTPIIEELSGIYQADISSDRITQVELGEASLEVVEYFSSRWQEPIDQVTNEFRPRTATAQKWFPKKI